MNKNCCLLRDNGICLWNMLPHITMPYSINVDLPLVALRQINSEEMMCGNRYVLLTPAAKQDQITNEGFHIRPSIRPSRCKGHLINSCLSGVLFARLTLHLFVWF
ncbi:hypothetical protein ILYODFUR_009534 [Ilyodon furcidens]|uniref:Uncharacterized protein n=1 Tax=Ilyodon furcidens TaxID=33524 RepID=A0ABV0SJV4_9TELE